MGSFPALQVIELPETWFSQIEIRKNEARSFWTNHTTALTTQHVGMKGFKIKDAAWPKNQKLSKPLF